MVAVITNCIEAPFVEEEYERSERWLKKRVRGNLTETVGSNTLEAECRKSSLLLICHTRGWPQTLLQDRPLGESMAGVRGSAWELPLERRVGRLGEALAREWLGFSMED